jgi:L-threonylcarbamoyladenylate synthase
VLAGAGAVVATRANAPGGQEPRALRDVPPELAAGAAAVLDGGELPGTASTVLDLTGPEPRVVREGAGDVAGALARIRDALA